jgi:hypothetical protein
MTRLSPQTLTSQEQAALLLYAAGSPREALLFSLALGQGYDLPRSLGSMSGTSARVAGSRRTWRTIRDNRHPPALRAFTAEYWEGRSQGTMTSLRTCIPDSAESAMR